MLFFFFSSRRRHTRCALVTGVQTCALPIFRMLDRDGQATLTFRAVARELDITVGALSRYFKNLADLQDEVAAQIMATLRPLSAVSKRGLREQLLQLGVEFLEINRAHPYLLTIQGPATAAVIARQSNKCCQGAVKFGTDMEAQ